MKKSKGPRFTLRDADGNIDAPLLDRLMSRSNESLKEQGIDIQKIGQTNNKQKPMWGELDALYQSIANGICESIVNYKEVYDHVKQHKLPNAAELALTTVALVQDTDTISKRLIEVYNRHKDFKGPVQDGDEMTIHANCGNDYTGLSIQWQSLIHPAYVTLTEYQAQANFALQDHIKAEEKEAESMQLSPEQDPNVITDVEVKE